MMAGGIVLDSVVSSQEAQYSAFFQWLSTRPRAL